MTKVKEIQAAIESLAENEYARFRRWFAERDWEKWDEQLKKDSGSGKLDFLIKEADEEKAIRRSVNSGQPGWGVATGHLRSKA